MSCKRTTVVGDVAFASCLDGWVNPNPSGAKAYSEKGKKVLSGIFGCTGLHGDALNCTGLHEGAASCTGLHGVA
jgi:hypothetical protein